MLAERLETRVDIDGAKIVKDDARLHYQIYRLSPPMQPGESRHMRFSVAKDTRGFENSLTMREIMPNGTFFNNSIAPQIGYQTGAELENKNKRKKYGLPEKDLMPTLERNCSADCMNTYLSNNSDWVDVETVISTPPGQTAIAPGSLLRQWDENGRCYSHYRLDHVGSISTPGYQLIIRSLGRRWNGIDIEVYYLAEHPWNVPKMLRSVRNRSNISRRFMVLMRRSRRASSNFPGSRHLPRPSREPCRIPESIGFIANLKNPTISISCITWWLTRWLISGGRTR